MKQRIINLFTDEDYENLTVDERATLPFIPNYIFLRIKDWEEWIKEK